MSAGYRLNVASWVGERDGMALELSREADDALVAEVFEDDDTGERTVTLFEQGIPLAAVEWLLEQARSQL